MSDLHADDTTVHYTTKSIYDIDFKLNEDIDRVLSMNGVLNYDIVINTKSISETTKKS